MKRTFYSHASGCRVNEAERVEIDKQMQDSGYTVDKDNPALYILNTCAITGKAERETRQMIYQIRKKLPDTKIIITGCSATYWNKIGTAARLPVDLVVGNTDKEYLAAILAKRFGKGRGTGTGGVSHDKFLASGRLMLKIQDGCHRFCTYCIVPYLRGAPKSRTIADLVAAARRHGAVQEVVLTAINTEAFGTDTHESLTGLLDAFLTETDIPRIGFGSVHPWSITPEFIGFYGRHLGDERLLRFFHIPLQSGADATLRLMKRDYTREDFLGLLKRLADTDPYALIATDIIVGFLEESDRDFEQTYAFLAESPISRFHIFRYSKRLNTAAYYLGKRLAEPSPAVKRERARRLTELGRRKYRAFLDKLSGYSSDALFIGRPTGGYQEAILDNNVLARVAAQSNLSGRIKRVTITKRIEDTVLGHVGTKES